MATKNKGKMVQMLSPENYIRKKARTLPFYECRINEAWEDTHLAQLSVARSHINGNITVCFYLVDLMCLGIKDTDYMFNVPFHTYREQIEKINDGLPSIDIAYELAHNIVYAGLEFAEEYGFKPHKDFTSITRFMLEEDTVDVELIEIECGINEKPMYMRGPFDDEVKVKKIIAQLEKTAGPGNYSIIDEDDDFEDDEFDFEDDEFEGMAAAEKKELFLNLSSRLESLNEDEHKRLVLISNSIIDDLVDDDLHDKIFDEYYEDLNIATEENEIPDELLGFRPDDKAISAKVKNRFVDIYHLAIENPKQAAKELKIFEKETNGLPCVCFLELIILQSSESPKYPKILKEYALKYPDYPLIRILWATEQVTTSRNLQAIQEYPFKLKTFFPNRETIHSIEKYHFLTLHTFATAIENDINRIEAFNSVLGDLDLLEVDEEVLRTIISIIKVNYLLAYLTH